MSDIPALATGGRFELAAPYVVGEQGCTLYIPKRSGVVVDRVTALTNWQIRYGHTLGNTGGAGSGPGGPGGTRPGGPPPPPPPPPPPDK